MKQLLCGPHKHGKVIGSHPVGYTNNNQSSCPCVLYNLIVQHILFRILCFIRNIKYTEYRFIITGFTRSALYAWEGDCLLSTTIIASHKRSTILSLLKSPHYYGWKVRPHAITSMIGSEKRRTSLWNWIQSNPASSVHKNQQYLLETILKEAYPKI